MRGEEGERKGERSGREGQGGRERRREWRL